MALVYFDASALLKLCVADRGSELAAALWHRADVVVTSRISFVQVPAAIAQARRGALLELAESNSALQRWKQISRELYVVEGTAEQGAIAAGFAQEYDVRADDAWHLAAATTTTSSADSSRESLVAAWDEKFVRAARGENLTVVPW